MRKSFALWPVKLFSGKWTWLSRIYYVRDHGAGVIYEINIYYTEAEAIVLVLRGDHMVEKAILPFEHVVQRLSLPVVNVVMTGFAIFTMIYQFY